MSRAFSALNMAGLEQLAGSSQIATGALKGLSGAFALFGVVSWPVAIVASAVMGLSALVTAAGAAHRELEDLNKVLDANALALDPDPLKRYTDALTQATKVASASVQTYVKLAQARVAAEAASMAGGGDDDANLQSLCRECHEAKTAHDTGRTHKHTTGEDGWPSHSVGRGGEISTADLVESDRVHWQP